MSRSDRHVVKRTDHWAVVNWLIQLGFTPLDDLYSRHYLILASFALSYRPFPSNTVDRVVS